MMNQIKPNFAAEFQQAAMATLSNADWDGPIALVNFRKYRDQANYPDQNHPPCSGREAYAKFFEMTSNARREITAKTVFSADYICDAIDSGSGEWDEIVIVEFTSRQSFLEHMTDVTEGDYEEAMLHRFAGLEKFALVATRPK
jgi:hypothetical protein